MDNTYQHWRIETDADNIVWLTIDKANASVNALNREVLAEFDAILDHLQQNTDAVGMILQSGKQKGFIAGADIEQFTQLNDINEAVELVRKGQLLFDKVAALDIPTVAMIKGFCLGGGMELSLACDYRVAEDSVDTRMGLPEVKLGIHPGWGGTIRLPQLIGPIAAMDLILSGRTITARSAAKMGVVDAAVPMRQLKRAARYYVLNKPPLHKPSKLQQMLNLPICRNIIASMLRRKVAEKANIEHYPAPYAVIDNWVRDGARGERAMVNEANSIGRLLLSDTSKHLVQVFFLQEKLKSIPRDEHFSAQRVHVVGAGTMGGDIAAYCALKGFHVTLQDREPQYIAPAIKRAYSLFKKKLKVSKDIRSAMDRLLPDPQGLGIAEADIIIEAIYEDLQAKQDLFKTLEAQAKPTAILATNTSSIPLDEINTALQDPSRLIGIHFFNPVAMMPLVEVVNGEQTRNDVLQSTIAFVREIAKLPLPVKSSPGFLVNRVLMPYIMESVQLAAEGVPLTAIDRAAENFGMPMGPVELADTVGLDVCLSVAKNLMQHYGGSLPEQLETMVSEGKLGRKSGAGFYQYKKGKAVKPKLAKSYSIAEDVGYRMIMRMLNEAMACLREGVVENADYLDAGMVFGTGFAPFRAGPMHYAVHLGEDALREIFTHLEQAYGERFKLDEGWSQLFNKDELEAVA